MRTIINRFRQLENTVPPDERHKPWLKRSWQLGDSRLGASCEPLGFPPASYVGCRTIADRMLRTRQLLMAWQGISRRIER